MHKKYILPIIILMFTLLLSGCSKRPSETLNEKIYKEYIKNGRIDKYNKLYQRYDGIKIILWLNAKSDKPWIVNFTLWIFFSILPDLPEALATGGVLAIFYFIAWWLGVTLTGGGILAVLAWIGTRLGVIPGIPPAIMGIVYLGSLFYLLTNIFSLIF